MLTMSIMHLWLEKEAKLKLPWQLQEKFSADEVQEKQREFRIFTLKSLKTSAY